MSSTLAQHQGPASLPSDYALLSRYAGHHPKEQMESTPRSNSALRRASAPAPPCLRPQRVLGPMTSPHHFAHTPLLCPIPSENTPLVNPPVDEPIKQTSVDGSKMSIFWEELQILTRYALPVFALVLLVRCFYAAVVLTLRW